MEKEYQDILVGVLDKLADNHSYAIDERQRDMDDMSALNIIQAFCDSSDRVKYYRHYISERNRKGELT